MDEMKIFLKNCGLSKAIPVFKTNKITVDQLDELRSGDMKELLPALGDRLKLRKAIENKSGGKLSNRPTKKTLKKTERKLAPTKETLKNDPQKKDFVVQMLKNDQHAAKLYQAATKVLIEFSLFSFDTGCRPISPDWSLIDFADGSLNCILCENKIRVQTRAGSDMLWNVGNYKRHYNVEHSYLLGTEETMEINSFLEVLMTGTANETLPTQDGNKALTSTEREGLQKSKEQPAGSYSECHLDAIEIGCTKKRSAPEAFNETISKRLTIVDISSVSNRTSGCVKSTAIDSVEGTETVEDVTEPVDVDTYQKSISIEHANNIDFMNTDRKDSTSDDVRSLVTEVTSTGSKVNQANLKEKTKTDEGSTIVSIISGCEKIQTTINSVTLMEPGTHQYLTEIQQSNQQKPCLDVLVEDFLQQGTDVLSDVSKELDTDIEMFPANIGSNVIKPDGKTSKLDITIATTTENNEEEKLGSDETLPTQDGNKALTSTEHEGIQKSKEQPAGSYSECHLDAIEIGCTKKRSAPEAFNETISKRLTIVDISSVSNRTSGCVKSTAIDSVEGTETVEDVTEPVDVDTYQKSISIEHANNIDFMKTDRKDSTSDDVRSLVTEVTSTGSKVNQANLKEKTKTDEGSTIVSIISGCEKIQTTINSVTLMEPGTHQHLTEIQQSNQQKPCLDVLVEDFLEQGTDVLSDVSKELDTDIEMFPANIGSNVIKPDGKTSKLDITIATTTENNEEEKLGSDETLPTQDGNKALTSTEREGSYSECHLDAIEIGCTKKRSAPEAFNETISKRLTIVDISSVSNRTSGCVKSTAIDSVEGTETVEDVTEPVDVNTYQKSISIEHANNIDFMKTDRKDSTSDDVRSLVTEVTSTESKVNQADATTGNLNDEKTKTEELETDKTPSNDAKENHNSSRKAEKTLDGISEPHASSNGSYIASVVTGESVMTKNIVGNSHHSTNTRLQTLVFEEFLEFGVSDQFEFDTGMSNTKNGSMEPVPKPVPISDDGTNQADDLTEVNALTKTPNEALNVTPEPMVTEVTPTQISNQLDGAKPITETISTRFVVVDEGFLQEIDNISSTSTNELKETTAPNDWATFNEPESIQLFIGTMRNVSITSGCEKIQTTIDSMEVAEPVETQPNLTEIQQTNQQKLTLEGSDVLSDVSKELDTDIEMFPANVGSNVIKPGGKTSTLDITIATTTGKNEEEKLSSVPEWRKPGVKFGWAKKRCDSGFYPGFLFSKEEFRWITTKAKISKYSFKPVDYNEQITQTRKNKAQIGHLSDFNRTNKSSFE